MPEPGKNEPRKEFIDRCIPIVIRDGTAKDGKQGAAICFDIWRKSKGIANSVEELQGITANPGNITREQQEVRDSLLSVITAYGKFRKSAQDGADYRDSSPFGDQGIKCGNCYFFYQDRHECRIVLEDIHADDVCKYWLINPQLVAEENKEISVENREWDRKFINDLPDVAFAVIRKGGKKDSGGKTVPRSFRKLPHHKKGVTDGSDHKSVDLPHLRNALARISQTNLSDSERASARAHLMKHAKALGIGGEKKMSEEETPKETTAAAPAATPEPTTAAPAPVAPTPTTAAEPAPAPAEPAPAPVETPPAEPKPAEPAPTPAPEPAPTPEVPAAPVAPVAPAAPVEPAAPAAPTTLVPAPTAAPAPVAQPTPATPVEPSAPAATVEKPAEPKPVDKPTPVDQLDGGIGGDDLLKETRKEKTPEELEKEKEKEFLDYLKRSWGERFTDRD